MGSGRPYLERADFIPNDRFTVIECPNEAGKRNILEAVYVLGNVRSFREGKSGDLLRIGADRAEVPGNRQRGSH